MRNYKKAKEIWRLLGSVPINIDDEIEEVFLHFKKGTYRFDIWHWFEEKFDLSIMKDLMYLK